MTRNRVYERIGFGDNHVQVVHAELQAGCVDLVANRPQACIAVREVGAVDRVTTTNR